MWSESNGKNKIIKMLKKAQAMVDCLRAASPVKVIKSFHHHLLKTYVSQCDLAQKRGYFYIMKSKEMYMCFMNWLNLKELFEVQTGRRF